MLTLFRLNDPFRLIGVALLGLLLRLPFWLGNVPLTEAEQQWMLLGEQLSEGKQLYSGVWDYISPLSGAIYWLCFELFGKTRWPYLVLAWVISVYQAGLFNNLLIRKDIYNEKTYIPALLYMVFQSASVDFQILSPSLIGSTFLLLMLNSILELSDRGRDEDIFRVGITLGIAGLIHFPLLSYFIVVIWGVGSFKVLALRRLMLIIFGALIIWVGVGIYYAFLGIFPHFYERYLLANLTLSDQPYASLESLVWLQTLPLALSLWGLTKALGERGFVNFQVSCQQIMFIWLVSAAVALIIAPQFAIYQLYPGLFAVAFFITHGYLLQKRKWLMELSFLLTFTAVYGLSYAPIFFPKSLPLSKSPYESLMLASAPWEIEGESIWVLGEAPAYYQNNKLATPFLNWKLTEQYLESINSYEVVSDLQRYLTTSPPSYIVDKANMSEELFERLPLLKAQYDPDPQQPFIYKRKEP